MGLMLQLFMSKHFLTIFYSYFISHQKKVPAFTFLGIHIAKDLSQSMNATVAVKKTKHRLYFLRIFRKKNNNLQEKLFFFFFFTALRVSCHTASLCGMPEYAKTERRALINSVQKINGCTSPFLEELFSSYCLSGAASVV